MTRCQWCRQESSTDDVCEWCKRPLDPSWRPAATGSQAAPSDKLSFQEDTPDKNDRLLMFSMLGVVLMTLLAFGMSHFSKAAGADQPTNSPGIQIVSPQSQPTVMEQAPKGEGNLPQEVESPTQIEPSVQVPETRVQTPPAPVSATRYSTGSKRNEKLQSYRKFTSPD